MKVVIPGGSGQVGTLLARTLVAGGHEVVVLSRAPRPAPWRVVAWDAETVGPWAAELDCADVVVNLAGRSVNCRYGAANRRAILDSRVRSTRAVGDAITRAARPPRVWLQMSTATIYAHRFDAANDEATGVLGGAEGAPDTWRFSTDVAAAWERAAVAPPHTRLVLLRTAMVMSPDRGGVFDTLLGLVRRGLGGTAGDGRQYMSWIHERDFVRAVLWLVARDELAGPVNLAAPEPLPNREFMAALRAAWGTRVGLPASRWMLTIGAWLMRTETELILKSRRVVPGRLLASGFAFDFPTWPGAAAELCARRRAGG
ncbi:TIGR01777 family oxidoreductase [Urbifossiella limnaea]|uniref:Epimerase family protein n=1 Tax=Urbifossiella limnaea TaxID=2528023 RepID=A0A517Y201_9BACT|nr:Epimerase family protein [Urbifossiella limnaea]